MATTESEQFAALLRELKDRSGRSYGVLAGRLHMSTSTLHRYCNGDAVPNEYAPVERLARLCGATSEESVELHRRWILADEARRRARGANTGPIAAEPAPDRTTRPEAAMPAPVQEPEPQPAPVRENRPEPAEQETAPDSSIELPDVVPATPKRTGRFSSGKLSGKKVRLVLIGAAVVALAVPAVAVASLSGRDDDKSSTVADAKQSGPLLKSPSARPPSGSPSASPSPSGSPSPSPSSGSPAPKGQQKHTPEAGVPLSVGISSYDWDAPCGKFYLLDQKPGSVPPPPTNEQDRRSWARALGAVDGGDLKLELTATGKSQDSVVITGINVRVVERQAPLNWTAYSMGSGCGGGIVPQSFDINLDAAQPVGKPVAGKQADTVVPAKDFPFKVSTTDPEVFDLEVHTEAHDVSWYLEVTWSSGDRSGKIPVYDNGKPFRTSAVKGRPAYEYRLDTNVWDHLETG
ncbi:helix-turn-helix domain-containing protein [Streptomyces sp. NPDC050516]|uniref:helix-turn-helix domain-containing protein n=1 Tax=Streptomyces sp. NPDC050516 TaxID=3365621 RepID=UPI0037A40B9F